MRRRHIHQLRNLDFDLDGSGDRDQLDDNDHYHGEHPLMLKKYLLVFTLGVLIVGCSSPTTETTTTTTESTTTGTTTEGGVMSAPGESMMSTPGDAMSAPGMSTP